MSTIRLVGATGGLLITLIVFLRFRKGALRRSDFALGVFIGVSLAGVSILPQSVTVLRDVLALEQAQFSRLIAILIAASVTLWVLHLGHRVRLSQLGDQLDRLVRAVAVRDWLADSHRLRAPTQILVVIPAFNEAESIGNVVESVPSQIDGVSVGVVVIDDGSDDGTADRARDHGAAVVTSPMNRGGGAALRIGFDVADALGADIIVTMDADGQHRADDIPGLVKPVLADEADVVVGSRLLGGREKDSRIRLVGIYFFNFIIRLLTPVRITDCSSGFRALRRTSMHNLKLRQDQYHTTELIIEASRRGCRVTERPVLIRRRLSGTSKKGDVWTYGLSFAKAILRTWWR